MRFLVVDNLSNSHVEALERVQRIAQKTVEFVQLDICDREAMDKVFAENSFSAVIHFAGLKAVGRVGCSTT